MTIPILTIDHVVIMTADIERAVVFYCDTLGGKPRNLKLFREGKSLSVLSIELGGAVVNLQSINEPAYIVAEKLAVGTVDVCFRCTGPIEIVCSYFEKSGIPIIEGPVARCAADGVWGSSIYARDPDGNLLEFLTTADPQKPLF